MIKAITVTNFLGESFRMELARPDASGFAVLSIKGLDPGKANLNVIDYGINDGGFYNSARKPSRNIVISLSYAWNTSIEEARHRTYKYFPLKKQIKLLIETDTRTAEIDGYVESNEPNIFSKNEIGDISIICPNPYFYSSDEVQTTVFSGIKPMFEFPFCNDSLTDSLLIMSSIEETTERLIAYNGDADVGINILIHAVGPAKNITIYNTGTRKIMSLKIELVEGDSIFIVTEKGKKSIYKLQDGAYINAINTLTSNSEWLQLEPGTNYFAYTAEEGSENLQFTISNKIAYEGM